MNIYIYGNDSFEKEIYNTLENANIKSKLPKNSKIENIKSLRVFKSIIQSHPNDIYLIDDEKIIKKNSLIKKINFFSSPNNIEEEFLLDNGVADISVDSLKEIPKYILKKYEQQKVIKTNTNEVKELIKNKNKFSEFDSLNEDDILNALDNKNTSNSNLDDVIKLVSNLLDNKTLEISIKIKEKKYDCSSKKK